MSHLRSHLIDFHSNSENRKMYLAACIAALFGLVTPLQCAASDEGSLEVKELPATMQRLGDIELVNETTEYRRDGKLDITFTKSKSAGTEFGTEIRFMYDGDFVCKVGGGVNVTVTSKVGVHVDKQQEKDGFRIWVLIPEKGYFEYVEISEKSENTHRVSRVLDGDERKTAHKNYLELLEGSEQKRKPEKS